MDAIFSGAPDPGVAVRDAWRFLFLSRVRLFLSRSLAFSLSAQAIECCATLPRAAAAEGKV